jgi:carbon monoxide dehydrogenase subunit G
MEFESKEDIEAPIADVFAVLCEFESFERSIIRRGVELHRSGDLSAPSAGLTWDVKFDYRGKSRALHVKLDEFEPVTHMRFAGHGGGVDTDMRIELLALSPRRTRLSLSLGLAPKTLSARLMVQSLKLARTKLNRKFKLRVAELAKMTETRLSRAG